MKIRSDLRNFTHLVSIFTLLFVPTILAFVLYRIIPIQNVNPISIVSATASINAILWILVILQIFINYPLVKKYSITIIAEFNLFLVLVYVTAFKILIKALSLKGTPLPGSDIRGDLLTILKLANKAESEFWSGGNYPPVWPSLIGNIARILGMNPLYLFKPAEFIVLILSPIFVLYTWRLILNKWMSLIITINQTLVSDFNYKSLTLNLVIPLLIYVAVKVRDISSIKLFKFFIYGLLLGFISLTYFGYLYWIIPMLTVISLMLLVSKDREKYLDRHTYLYLGLGAGLGPVIYFRITENLYSYYLLIFGTVLLFLVLHDFRKLRFLSHLFFNVGLFLGLLVAFFTYRAGDAWVEGGIEKNDPTVNPIINLSGIGLLLFLALVLGVYLIIKFKKDFTVIIILTGIYLSSTIYMYFIASQMQVTSRVDLWPRAQEVQGYALNIIFLIITLFVIEVVLNESKFKKYLEFSKQNTYYLTSFILLILGSYLVGSLGASAHRSMPYHAFNPAWFAHQGCSNPHEDPMLSKVFETYPDIQAFLRENCSSVDWPVIPKKN
jgi:hypothetical protein